MDYDIEKIYQEMELHLISSMQRNLSRHLKEELEMGFNWPQWQAEKLKEIKRYQRENSLILSEYKNPINESVKKQLQSQFIEGTKKEQKLFKTALKNGYKIDKKINKSFFRINDKKVNKLIDSVNNDLSTANYAVLRMMNDTYRQTIHKAALFAGNGVMTEKQAIDMATKDFLERGLNCIEYSNGARVNIASYSKMAVRTASTRAMLQGEGEFRKKIGNPLVKITRHGTACELCQVWEGKILVDDVYGGGNPKDYPKYETLSYAMSKGLYHPNCRHGVGTYYEELEGISFNDDGPSLAAQEFYEKDVNKCNQQIQRFARLSNGSLDENNIKKYNGLKKVWEDMKIKQLEMNSKTGQDLKAIIKPYKEKINAIYDSEEGIDSGKHSEKFLVELTKAKDAMWDKFHEEVDKIKFYSPLLEYDVKTASVGDLNHKLALIDLDRIARVEGLEISTSPYSLSTYALEEGEEIDWGYKPTGSYRVSNHWNFESKGAKHCQLSNTDEYVKKTYLTRYNGKTYDIIYEYLD